MKSAIMKSTIWKKILYLQILPFSVIYIILSIFIVLQVYKTQTKKVAQQLHSLALYNEASLRTTYDAVELSVQIAASELEKINPNSPNAREIGENIITSRFQNPRLVNAWLAFEPNAFDRQDPLHSGDHPGVPSGRYIRSFLRNGDFWHLDPDIDEADWSNSYWYRNPMETRSVFTDFGSPEYDLLWDYGNGPISSICISAPVFRNNRAIGSVGLDVAINEDTLGDQLYNDAGVSSAIFLVNGTFGYSLDTEKVGKTLEELGFGGAGRIRDHMKVLQPVQIDNEYSGITGAKSFSYFYPVQINDKHIYICTSMPQHMVWLDTAPVLLPIGTSLLISLGIFSLLFVYLSRGVAVPLRNLARASESLASGNLDVQIKFVHSGDEMEMITRSLARMAEQFRVSKLVQERSQNRFDIIIRIHNAMFHSRTLDDTFDKVLSEIADYFHIYKASLIVMKNESPRVCSIFPITVRDEGDAEFFCHQQVAQLTKGKKHLVMNYGALAAAQLSFVSFDTKSLCILPLRVNGRLRGYIIMEGKDQEAFVHDDTTLIFIGTTLSDIIGCRIDWEQAAAEASAKPDKGTGQQEMIMPEDHDEFIEKAKSIQGLDVDKGILLIGGEKEKYTELIKITIKVVTEGIQKMRELYLDDLPAFAIEVHGMKAALYNIGAELWGDEARQLEFAAKSEDAGYCTENYPVFEERLRTLSRNLAALFPRQERNSQSGSTAELAQMLPRVRELCGNFDTVAAASLLSPFIASRWEDQAISDLLAGIEKDLENLEYDAAEIKIKKLQESLKDTTA